MNGKAKLTVIFILCAVYSGYVSGGQLWCPVNCPDGVGNVLVWDITSGPAKEVHYCIVGQNCSTSPSTKPYTMIVYVPMNTFRQLQCGVGSPILHNNTVVDLADCFELQFSTCAYGTPCQVFCPVSANASYRIWNKNGDEFQPCKSEDCLSELSDSWKPDGGNSTILPVRLHAGGIHECRADDDFGNLKLTYIYMTAPPGEDDDKEMKTTTAEPATTLTIPSRTGAETTTGAQLTKAVPMMAPAGGIGVVQVISNIVIGLILFVTIVIIIYWKILLRKQASAIYNA
ncbi:uncharacterized protein LOC118431015 [Branchiostoma floridae]|uniref:Uncharacterized protein LOC118431015 n=1 Tax=Branchiostoma floridae TaxID=7739 RepID=A0A9J7MBX2_BRAFL|nr:uncharacterized protein LOC118431015 [Branchiostoma floridae]